MATGSDWDGGSYPWTVTENQRYLLGQECIIKKLYILLTGSPGAGNTYTFSLNIVGDSDTVQAVIADAATTGNSGALEDTIADSDYLTLKVVPASTPTVQDAYWGFVVYNAVWTGKIAGVTNPAEIMGVAVGNIAEVKGVA